MKWLMKDKKTQNLLHNVTGSLERVNEVYRFGSIFLVKRLQYKLRIEV
jgi:hypothetical protein